MALQHEQEPRSEVLAKMIERAKQLESTAEHTLRAVADMESGRPTNGSRAEFQIKCQVAWLLSVVKHLLHFMDITVHGCN